MIFRQLAASLLLCCAALGVHAQESIDLELEEGFVHPGSGVRVDRIIVSPDGNEQEIRLAVPRSAGPVEEVLVTAPRLKGITLPQLRPHEFVRDYDNDYYGLVIFLGRKENVPIRLYLDSRQQRPGDLQP
jgi:hypothetical protein